MEHEEAVGYVQERVWGMIYMHWCFWIPVHTANFYFVPFRHRVLPAQVALLGWSSFM